MMRNQGPWVGAELVSSRRLAWCGGFVLTLLTQQAIAQSVPSSPSDAPSSRPAPSVEDKAAADALFDSALKMMKDGNYAGACEKLQKSHTLDPAVGTLLNLGRCYNESGQTASAWTSYREAASMARTEGQSDREKLARDEASALELRLVRVRLIVSEEIKELPELVIKQNGQDVSLSLLGEPLPVNPGLQTVEVSSQGKAGTFTVQAEKEGLTYSLNIDQLESSGPGEHSESVPLSEKGDERGQYDDDPAGADDSNGPKHLGPIILGASGIASIGLGTAFAFIAKSHDNNAREICTDPQVACTASDVEEWENELSDAEDNASLAYLSWGLGGAAVVGAVVWWMLEPAQPETSATNMKMAPIVTHNLWGVSAKGTF